MKIIQFDSIGSTNDYLKEHLDTEEYTIISTKEQTKGRGRQEKKFVSADGMIMFSFIVKERETMDIKEAVKIPLLSGISLLSALKKIINVDFKFKWTNDLYLNDKKVSGILVEKVKDKFIIGIGLNLNNITPKEIENIATSIYDETGEKHEPEETIHKIVSEFQTYYNRFLEGKWLEIVEEINEFNYLKDKNVKITIGEKETVGKALNISNDGRLEVLIGDEVKLFNIGEISLSREFL